MNDALWLAAGVALGAALAVVVMVVLVNRREKRLDSLRSHLTTGHGIDGVNLDDSGDHLRGLHSGIHSVITALQANAMVEPEVLPPSPLD